ncbi:MAG: hypothetical protein HZB91_08205 [Elusimicrobia bacterium]|nr:hypothetical protein [Elusimicrobiota bacterium]
MIIFLAAPLAANAADAAPAAGADSRKPLAATFVSSKEWMMRRSPVKEEEFTGDVRYWTYSRFVRADWALYRHDDETWAARGNIRAEHTLPRGRGVCEVFGEKAVFDQKRRTGSLTGKKGYVDVVLSSPGGGKDFGRAGRLVWEFDKNVSLLDGVRLWGDRVEAWADRADYDQVSGVMRLSGGRPVLHKKIGDWTAAIKADTIIALEPVPAAPGAMTEPGYPRSGPFPQGSKDAGRAETMPSHLLAEGAVRGWIDFKNKPVSPLEP